MVMASWKTIIGGVTGVIMAAAMPAVPYAADFAGTNTGPIPDDNPAGRSVVFDVSGMTAPLAEVRLSVDLTHTFVRDLRVTLVAPGGIARRVVFARTGFGANFGAADLDGTYRFHDAASGDWWAAAETEAVLPSGEYRASTEGMGGDLRSGGCANSLSFVFRELSTAQLNGLWTLNVADVVGADLGAVSAATLTLLEADETLFGNGFDTPALGECVRAQFDYTGSNRSSYLLVRNTGGGSGGAVTWYIRDNDGTANGFMREVQLGISTDFFVGGDFDGDGIWDPATWSPEPTGTYRIKMSSRPADAPPVVIEFGQLNDDPSQSGDYDGDGVHDLAVHRTGAIPGAPSFTLVRLSSTGLVRILPTGEQGQFAAGGSDMNGDGIADVAMQRNAGGGNAEFNVYSGADGSIVSTFMHGTPSDLIVSGNHAGDARADVMVARGSGGNLVWSVRDAAGGVLPDVVLGVSATDYALSGDFDGDGRDDHAVWRPSSTPGQSRFVVRQSTGDNAIVEVPMGHQGDYPVANSRTH